MSRLSRQVHLGVRHLSRIHDQFSLLFLIISRQLWIYRCGEPSLTRSRVCGFEFLLDIASAAFPRSESHRTHEHILLSLFLRLPQPGGPGSCIYFPLEQSSPVIPPAFDLLHIQKIVTPTHSTYICHPND
jgi:hypothetical protein